MNIDQQIDSLALSMVAEAAKRAQQMIAKLQPERVTMTPEEARVERKQFIAQTDFTPPSINFDATHMPDWFNLDLKNYVLEGNINSLVKDRQVLTRESFEEAKEVLRKPLDPYDLTQYLVDPKIKFAETQARSLNVDGVVVPPGHVLKLESDGSKQLTPVACGRECKGCNSLGGHVFQGVHIQEQPPESFAQVVNMPSVLAVIETFGPPDSSKQKFWAFQCPVCKVPRSRRWAVKTREGMICRLCYLKKIEIPVITKKDRKIIKDAEKVIQALVDEKKKQTTIQHGDPAKVAESIKNSEQKTVMAAAFKKAVAEGGEVKVTTFADGIATVADVINVQQDADYLLSLLRSKYPKHVFSIAQAMELTELNMYDTLKLLKDLAMRNKARALEATIRKNEAARWKWFELRK